MYKNFAEKYFFAYRICIIYVFVCVYLARTYNCAIVPKMKHWNVPLPAHFWLKRKTKPQAKWNHNTWFQSVMFPILFLARLWAGGHMLPLTIQGKMSSMHWAYQTITICKQVPICNFLNHLTQPTNGLCQKDNYFQHIN